MQGYVPTYFLAVPAAVDMRAGYEHWVMPRSEARMNALFPAE